MKSSAVQAMAELLLPNKNQARTNVMVGIRPTKLMTATA